MIRLTVEIREGVLTHRTTVTASSIERALQTVEGQTGRGVRLILPIETEERSCLTREGKEDQCSKIHDCGSWCSSLPPACSSQRFCNAPLLGCLSLRMRGG
jgi:hypothetical protein